MAISCRGRRVQQHDVNITRGVELAPAVTANCDQGHRLIGAALVLCGSDGRRKNVSEKDIDDVRAQCANFAASATGLVSQTQPVFLNFKESFVEGKDLPLAAWLPWSAAAP